MTRISVFTPTGTEEKIPFLKQALVSLQAQTMTDWEWWVLDNSPTMALYHMLEEDAYVPVRQDKIRYVYDNDFDRSQVNFMPVLLNRYYPEANGDLIFYMSDDDLLDPNTFKVFVDFFDSHPDEYVCWASLQMLNVTSHEDAGRERGWIKADKIRHLGELDCQVDGGQICHRKSALAAIEQPYFPESANHQSASHCDGQFMEKLAAHFPFHPVGDPEVAYAIHRFTPVSYFTPWHGGPYPGGKVGV
jgi:glycosyltransferase involved in cell wall biosynthesis